MKTRLITFIIAAVAFASPLGMVAAQTATPSSTRAPQTATGSAQMEDLKARLATKVAELRTVVKRAMYGTVKSVSVTSAAIETKTKDIKIELTDDVTVTQLISGKRTNLSIEDIETKDNVTVFGTYDETLDLLKAQFIFIESTVTPVKFSGIVADVDKEDYVLTINTSEGKSFTVDIENTTKTIVWSKEGGLVKGGFSKIAVGDTVHITGTPVAKKENNYRGIRVLNLGNITGSASTPTTTVTPVASASATPRNTPRPTVTP
ncbi:hypothetical protein HZB58_05420 [Candidatus Gottesmanbacteria bacterium]|nr:hypothetical protein [Candidatus Gottesmanbacteria bacterium]